MSDKLEKGAKLEREVKLKEGAKLEREVKLKEGAKLEREVKLERGVKLEGGVKLGREVKLERGVKLEGGVKLGREVKLEGGVKLGREVKFKEGVKLEKEIKKRQQRQNLQKIILATVASFGILSVALMAPNVIGAMAKLGILPRRREQEYIKNSKNKLAKAGLLYRNNKGMIRLTKEGENKLRHFELNDFRLKIPRKWDKKWRLLIFDIPEYRKSLREKLRKTLLSIGFKRLQDSVWIYPYDCEDLITLLKADFRVGKDLMYLIVDKVEYDRSLINYFGLR